jgi:hypothetical protein
MIAYPEHVEVTLYTIRMFIPELEAMLDGKGDIVYITSEHLETLKTELDWFTSVGSPALKEDIQKEQKRFPLDNFIGMTMDESWKHINSQWTPDMVIQPTSIPESVVQLSPTPALVVNTVLAPGSKGKFEVPGGAYLEYLSSYDFQVVNEEPVPLGMKKFSFHPKLSVDQQQRRYWIILEAFNASPAENEIIANNMYSSGGVIWEKMIQTEEFEGVEYIFSISNGAIEELGALLYNQESQLFIRIYVRAPDFVSLDANFAELIDKNYPHFQHLVDNLHIQVP